MIYLNCIRLAPNGSIAVVGGTSAVNGAQKHYTEAEAISAINAGAESFVVRDADGHEANVRVAHHSDRQFLETHRDGVKTDNLGQLPTCHHVPVSSAPPPYRPVPVHRGHPVCASCWGKHR